MPPTSASQFKEILRTTSDEYRLEYSDEDLNEVVSFIDGTCKGQLSGSLARDLVSIEVDNAEYEGRTPSLIVAAVDVAYQQFTGLTNGAAGAGAVDRAHKERVPPAWLARSAAAPAAKDAVP
jgi:hypothetical protein